MPLLLPQLSRRQFLKRAALAGAAVALAPQVSHAALFGKSRDKNTFAFFSDIHIAGDVTLKHSDVNMADNFSACVRELAAWPVKPATVIVNGDLAFQTAQPADYAALAKLIEPLRAVAPIHLSLGNHDGRDPFWSAFPQDAAAQSSTALHRQATTFASDHANWFLLDSLIATNSTPGEVGTTQLDWLTHELDLRADKPAIVVVHHHPQFTDQVPGLKDTAALMAALAQRRQVKALIFGHTHDWQVTQHDSGIHLINLPPTAYLFKAGRPNGWVHVTLAEDSAEFELRSLDPKHPEHAVVKTLKWRSA
ncbi:MAG TPA: metallophosphoesterase [Verrucomicrobiae bacterium]|jgi:predicted phosphodiesterase